MNAMSLREQLILKDGKARPPTILYKVCVHNGSADLPSSFAGDMAFDTDFIFGRQEEIYVCIQCGHTLPLATMLAMYQRYMLFGTPILTGRNIK